jgi:DNA-binding GntR family transcriptional regulator
MTNASPLPTLSLPPKRTLAEDVTEQLRDAIFRGHFSPGQRLSEEQLAKTLGVSRGPIREAFVRLEREGLIVSQANRRSIVAQLSRRDLEEVYTMRLALERLAVQYAVQAATALDLAAMEANTATLNAALAQGLTEQEAATLDVSFHDLIYQAARHRHVQAAWAAIRSEVYLFLLSRNRANADYRDRSIARGHADIVAALRARDSARAVAEIEFHLRGAYSYIVQGFPEELSGPLGELAATTQTAPDAVMDVTDAT